MSVFNGARFVEEAVRSILDQTFTDFELLAFDDGSTDATPEILNRASRADPRVRVITQANAGLTRTLNRGLSEARGELVARQDADDRSAPDRLARQVAWLDAHPRAWVVGTRYAKIDEAGRRVGRGHPPRTSIGVRLRLLTRNALAHSSVCFRRREILGLGGYDERLATAQDYDLWCRTAVHADIGIVPAPLIERREHAEQVGRQRWSEQEATRDAIAARYRRAVLARRVVSWSDRLVWWGARLHGR